MDIILRNENLYKVKLLKNVCFSASYGLSGTQNEFKAELPYQKDADLKLFSYINYGNSEFGGKVLEKVIDTDKGTVTLYGSTLRGIMQNIICTPTADLIISGTDEELLQNLFSRTGLAYNIEPNYNAVKKSVYVPIGSTLLQAVETALTAFNEKFKLYISKNVVCLKILPAETLSSRVDAVKTSIVLDDNKMMPNAYHGTATVNGSTVSVSVYIDPDGNVTDSRHYSGDKSIEKWKAYTNDFKTTDELKIALTNDLLRARNKASATDIKTDLKSGDVGDRVKVSVQELNAVVTQTVAERLITIKNNIVNFEYTTGG